jgi:hypothetical protein
MNENYTQQEEREIMEEKRKRRERREKRREERENDFLNKSFQKEECSRNFFSHFSLFNISLTLFHNFSPRYA